MWRNSVMDVQPVNKIRTLTRRSSILQKVIVNSNSKMVICVYWLYFTVPPYHSWFRCSYDMGGQAVATGPFYSVPNCWNIYWSGQSIFSKYIYAARHWGFYEKWHRPEVYLSILEETYVPARNSYKHVYKLVSTNRRTIGGNEPAIGNYLRCYSGCHRDDWDSQLTAVESSYNSELSEEFGASLFRLDLVRKPKSALNVLNSRESANESIN